MISNEDLIKLRNYFGEHDKTAFEHWAYDILNKATQPEQNNTVSDEEIIYVPVSVESGELPDETKDTVFVIYGSNNSKGTLHKRFFNDFHTTHWLKPVKLSELKAISKPVLSDEEIRLLVIEKLVEHDVNIINTDKSPIEEHTRIYVGAKKAGIEIYKAALSKGGARWVKADGRLPDKSKLNEWFSLKLKGFPVIGKFIKFIGSDELGFDIEKYGQSEGILNHLLWLDESPMQLGEGWISVDDDLPEKMLAVYIFIANKFQQFQYGIGFIDGLKKWSVYYDDNEAAGYYPSEYITHWKKIEPPCTENNLK